MTEQNKNEVSELERKWQEDLLLALSRYKDNYQESFNNLPLSLQDEAHGINYERGLDSDEIIAFMIAYLAARKSAQVEIDELKSQSHILSSWEEMKVKLKSLEQENEALIELGIDSGKEIDRLNALIKKKPMTVEDMIARWPELPPFDARHVCIMEKGEGRREINFEVTQDELKNIRDYLDAVEECMN